MGGEARRYLSTDAGRLDPSCRDNATSTKRMQRTITGQYSRVVQRLRLLKKWLAAPHSFNLAPHTMRAVLLTTLLASLICSSVPHRTLSASPPGSVLLQLQVAASASLLRRRAFHALSAYGVPPSQGKCFRWGTKSLRVLGGVTSCVCRAGYVGANCHLTVAALAVHPHGRYVGPVLCERGAIVDGQCQCDAGWEGYHCALPKCPGTWRCPPGAKAGLCAKAVCVCADREQVASNPTYFGY